MASGLPGQRVEYYRHLRGWSQEELARRARTTGASIWRIENDEQNYTRNLLRRIAAVFGVTVAHLFQAVVADQEYTCVSPREAELLALSKTVPTRVFESVLALLRTLNEPIRTDSPPPSLACLALHRDKIGKHSLAH